MLRVFILVLCMESQWHKLHPPAFPLARICLISPNHVPPTGSSQHVLTLQALLSIQPNQSTSRPPQNLWSSWSQVSDPSPLGKLFLTVSTCSHAQVIPPSCRELALEGVSWPLGPQQWCLTCCIQKEGWAKTCCLPGMSYGLLPDCAGMGMCTASPGHGGAEQL